MPPLALFEPIHAVATLMQDRWTDACALSVGGAFGNIPTPAMGGEANAAIIAYLLSEASAGVQGQVVRIEGNQMALVSHPAVILPVQQREEGWTLPAVESAFKTAFADRLVPLGFTGVDIAGYAMPASFRD